MLIYFLDILINIKYSRYDYTSKYLKYQSFIKETP
jgi:hypothetical protein